MTHAHGAGFAALAAAWLVMMTAMMTPAALPWLRAFATLTAGPTRSRARAAAAFAAGYFAVWSAYSIIAAAAQLALQHTDWFDALHGRLAAPIGGAVLIAAGLLQFAPFKRACLTHCRNPLTYLMTRWRNGPPSGFRVGLSHGAFCVGCCWALMAAAFALGVMNLWWMLALTAIVTIEQVLPRGDRIGRGAGLAMAIWGAAMLAGVTASAHAPSRALAAPSSHSSPAQPAPPARPAPPALSVVEATIPEMRQAMADGRVTSRELVTQYLARIGMYEDRINAVIAVNPHAIEDAEALDRERAQGHVRGPLHGIPIALKDNIQTTDVATTGGALAFAGFVPPYEATLVKNLRAAGAVIIAKTTLTELANWVAAAPTPMPGNYSAVGGMSYNPYDPRRDPREGFDDGRPVLSTGGSSSGAGTAASFWAANVGTDTSGSVVNPAQLTMLVGLRPTTGRISRHGIIPITADQDTAGPMARTVTDAAILFGAIESPSPDPDDPATTRCTPPPGRDYTAFLKRDGLKGARIGVPRAFFYEKRHVPGEPDGTMRGGLNPAQSALMDDALGVLKREGAVLVDPADLPSVLATDPADNMLSWETCSGLAEDRAGDAHCSVVFKYGMKRDFNAWLQSLGAAAPVPSLTGLRMFNLTHTRGGAIRYGQANLDISDEMDLVRDKARYDADRARDVRLAGDQGLQAAIDAHHLDALVFPGWNAAGYASRPGFPILIVPFGSTPNAPSTPFPAGFDAKPVPFGVSFVGAACGEPTLFQLAYAFEQATKRRVPPRL
jgi:amidase